MGSKKSDTIEQLPLSLTGLSYFTFLSYSHLFSTIPELSNSSLGASLLAQWSRIHLPVQEVQVQSLGQKDTLEKEMATHSSILEWEIPWTEEPGGLQSIGSQKSGTRLSN